MPSTKFSVPEEVSTYKLTQGPAKITVEYEADGKLYTVTGMVSEPVLRIWQETPDWKFDSHPNAILDAPYKCFEPKEYYLTFKEHDDGKFLHMRAVESPAYAKGYKAGIEAERKRIKDVIDDTSR